MKATCPSQSRDVHLQNQPLQTELEFDVWKYITSVPVLLFVSFVSLYTFLCVFVTQPTRVSLSMLISLSTICHSLSVPLRFHVCLSSSSCLNEDWRRRFVTPPWGRVWGWMGICVSKATSTMPFIYWAKP